MQYSDFLQNEYGCQLAVTFNTNLTSTGILAVPCNNNLAFTGMYMVVNLQLVSCNNNLTFTGINMVVNLQFHAIPI